MSYNYSVAIPVKTMVRAGIQGSSSCGLPSECVINGILKTRLVGQTPYLDFEVSADSREEAIMNVLPNAIFFVQLVAFVYGMAFEIDMPNVHAARIGADTELSDYYDMQPSPANLDELAYIWKQFDTIQGSEKGNVIKRGIEWVYLGKIMKDDRNALTAYTTALELLLEYKEGKKDNTTVYKKYKIEDTKLEEVQNKIRAVLQEYIEKEAHRERIITYMRNTELESRKTRWTKKLKEAKLEISEDEINKLYAARSGTSHSGKGTEMPVSRVYEIVSKYLMALLRQG